MKRRAFLTAAPSAALIAAFAAGDVDAAVAELLSVDDVKAQAVAVPEVPFLHVLDGPISEWHRDLKAGDMVLIVPGRPRWDTTCLMRDGRFAAVSVVTPTRVIEAKILGEDETIRFDPERAEEMIAGRAVKWIRLDRGLWMD
jgi:hypothetical protein